MAEERHMFTSPVSRRRVLVGGALAMGGSAMTGAAMGSAFANSELIMTPVAVEFGTTAEGFHGPHQAGIATPPQAHAVFLACDLLPGINRDGVIRLMRLLSDDAARLASGRAALGDTEPELAAHPARLTVTFGFGPGLFRAAGLPSPVSPLPGFAIDRLEEQWSGGDLLLQICADDPMTVAHAQRMLVKDARPFARIRFCQQGFRRAVGVQSEGSTQRNLMGQVDGTVNPTQGDFDAAVWIDSGPLRGGTTMVLRRIRAELETWDAVDRDGKEFAIGRRLDTGAPLTGHKEHDEPDFSARGEAGFPVIAEGAHIRRAHNPDPRSRIFRRPYNYDGMVTPEGHPDSGLIFVSYQADISRQFIPVQERLAESDLLNEWTTPIGSAVYFIPPGCEQGRYIGQTLLEP